MSDSIEVYLADALHPFLSIQSSFQLHAGDLLNIRGETFHVKGRSFTIDRGGKADQSIRCNLIVELLGEPSVPGRHK